MLGLISVHNPMQDDLKSTVDGLVRISGASAAAVAFHDLQTGAELLIDADESFHAASLIKVPLMMELYRRANEGKLQLTDSLPIKSSFKSIADGSEYTLSAEDDSDAGIYKRIGQAATVRDLIERMITMSSNLATNVLFELATGEEIMRMLADFHIEGIVVRRGVMDMAAFERGMNNLITARGMLDLMEILAERKAVSANASNEMVNILLKQKHREGIPSALPPGTRVANKTGSFTGTSHDAAIVYPPGRTPYVLIVLTRGIQDDKRAQKLIADISAAAYCQLAK